MDVDAGQQRHNAVHGVSGGVEITFDPTKNRKTHTMPTPMTTTTTEAMTGVLKCLPSQKRSTAHTNGMFISFMICAAGVTAQSLSALKPAR